MYCFVIVVLDDKMMKKLDDGLVIVLNLYIYIYIFKYINSGLKLEFN